MTTVFTNTLFFPVMNRVIWIFGSGVLLVILFNIKNLSKTFTSETWKRYIGWLIIAPVFLTGIFFGGIVSLIIVGIIMLKALIEFANLENLSLRYKAVLIVNGLISLTVAAFAPQRMDILPFAYIALPLGVSIFSNKPFFMFRKVGVVLFGCLWICYTLSYMVLYRTIVNGTGLLILIGFAVAFADIGAYSFGKLLKNVGFGIKNIIAIRISPNKTWAGTMGTLLGAAVATILFSKIAGGLNLMEIITISVTIAICAMSGDLTESLVKRSCGVKDSGTLIPGHGGILDRIDSLLFSLVAIYHLRIVF